MFTTAVASEPGAAPAALGAVTGGPWWAALIPGLPLFSTVLVALCAVFRVKSKLPAWITVGCLAASFVLTVQAYLGVTGHPGPAQGVHILDWIQLSWGGKPGQTFIADFGLYLDPLTMLWMLFVTGLATLIALYASEYMSHDLGAGYCRFFFAFSLFVFAMSCLVMADNLILLYLGWEGVGLCSYLLIGYFYKKPSAVEAAKKAFIMNRIGDLGLALGIMLCFVQFGTVRYAELFAAAKPYIDLAAEGRIGEIPLLVQLIPVLFTVGAFGKSAQLPLYVWLPDAMEGPTPVSALIHAATMVTAGVYLVARMLPLFQCSTWALPIVAWTGAATALLAATIGMAQFDIKRIMAYSTVSQLGYMFAGLGVLTSAGAAYHVFTHAFFKATLFLGCGAVMHGFAGQLDLRKLSGVAFMKGWGIVGLAMLIGCLNLAGFPYTAGFFSKDVILAEAFASPAYQALGWVLLATAGLTAYYTFRVFFRVFVGPKHYEAGDELHAHEAHDSHDAHGTHDSHGKDAHAPAHDQAHHGEFHPHPPGWAINLVMAVLTVGCLAAAYPYFIHWVPDLVTGSSAKVVEVHAAHGEHAHGTFFGYDPHQVMYYVSAIVGATGIFLAFVLHFLGRRTAATANADRLLPLLGPVARWAQHKWYVDEFYNFLVRVPLLVISHILHLVDKLFVDGLVDLAGLAPRAVGQGLRPQQSGLLNGYAVGMVVGVGIIAGVGVVLMW